MNLTITAEMIAKASEVEAASRDASYAGRKGKAQKQYAKVAAEFAALCNNDQDVMDAATQAMFSR